MPAFVYLVRNKDLHKIGRTENLERRMKQLQPDEIVEVLETDRSRDLEYELHQLFKAKRLPQTEYFRLTEDEVNLARMRLGWQPESKPSLPAPNNLNPEIAQARKQTRIAAVAFVISLGLFGAENLISGTEPNSFQLLGMLVTVVFSAGALIALIDGGVHWLWSLLWSKR